MAKIPFKVSARTARLIGRENIASSKGAIVELVKNCYDADSPFALIYFNKQKDELYIIDAGEGMTQEIIVKHWMTIGTDNKTHNIFTKTGRVKAGAKGIGRFALDKLGNKCKMITKPNPKIHKDNKSYVWYVNWQDFEGEFKTIDTINAKLYNFKNIDLKTCLKKYISNAKVQDVLEQYKMDHGTILKITNLRDNWEDFFIEQVYEDLEVLIPPKEQSKFKLFLISEEKPNKYGEVKGSICDDYDYKVVAKADKNQNVNITIYRNEYDVEAIPSSFFKRELFQKYPYRKEDFYNKKWNKNTTFAELIPGYKEIDKENILSKIGEFEFTFYFMKRTYSQPDKDKFYYIDFNARDRQYWLNKFGGIKLFRDEFRVRPYGEIKNSAFDWLGLGARKSKNPAPPSHPSGKWQVEPDNISGAISISRIENIDFQDKSSREGLQENKTFLIFKKLILGIIQVFETDRSTIAREFFKFYQDIHKDTISQKDIEKITKRVLSQSEAKNTKEDKEKIVLAKTIEKKDEEIKILEDEQKILRGMATSGIVTASFTHELSNLNDILSNRVDELKELFEDKAPLSKYENTPEYLNPYILLEDMKRQDTKLQNWLKISLESAKKDKRRRKKIVFYNYFENFKNTWHTVFENRKITFELEMANKDIDMRALEIDLDSIFNNLIVNSIDSFMRQKGNSQRRIKISVSQSEKEIYIDYFDNGVGLSKDISNHEQIFDALFTTKRNEHTGEEIGTGLGMWLVKSIVKEYDGKLKLLYPKTGGFGLRIKFIRKFIRN